MVAASSRYAFNKEDFYVYPGACTHTHTQKNPHPSKKKNPSERSSLQKEKCIQVWISGGHKDFVKLIRLSFKLQPLPTVNMVSERRDFYRTTKVPFCPYVFSHAAHNSFHGSKYKGA